MAVWCLRRRGVLPLLLLLIGTPCEAATLEITLRGPKAEGIAAVVRARRVDGAAAVIEQEVKVPSSGTIALPEGLWEARLVGTGLWAAPRFARNSEAIAFDAFPTGTIAGELRIDGIAATSIADPRVRFMPAGAGGNDGVEGVVDCTIADTILRCAVPAGTHDLRIGADGHSSHYAWSTTIIAGVQSDLGIINLRRGASLTGFVRLHPEVAVPLGEVRVVLLPSGTTAAERRSAVPDERGFFQLTSLAPGDYLMTSVTRNYRSDSRPVRIMDGMAADLKEPLMVSPPRRLQIEVDPPLDPDGKRWLVSVARRQGSSSDSLAHTEMVSESSADQAGRLPLTVVQDGIYLIDVKRDGSTWGSAEVEVNREVVVAPVAVKWRMTHGRITRGGRPLAAKLRFGGEFGATQQLLVSDEEGRFHGMLPTEMEDWEVLVESDAPSVRRTFKSVHGNSTADGGLEFRIEVPGTRQMGLVVREDGTPVQWALVDVYTGGEEPFLQQYDSGDDGVFELSGLEPGSYRLQAKEAGAESDIVDFEVKDSEQPPIQLVVRKSRRIAGRVVAGPRPISTATLMATPRGIRIMTILPARTNQSGEFSLRVPSNAQFYDLVVNADGFPSTMARMAVSKEPLVIDVAVPFGTLTVEAPEDTMVHLRHRGAEAGHLLLSYSAERGIDKAGSFDRLTFAKLEVGEYAVCLAQRCVPAYLAPYAVTKVSLR